MQLANQLLSYANAIFTIAKDKETQEKYYQQIAALDAMNVTNPDFYSILAARAVDKDERKELAMTVLSGYGFEPTVIYWVWTIIDNNNYHNFHYIALMCRNLYHDIFNITRVKITSANELSESQIDKIKDFFEKKLKRRIDVEWHIKPDLIGGLRIQVNNKTYNNTFRSKLEILKRELLSKKG
ncbi:MAG: ATP synthase F1 subunit delta [Mycoplasma sp.]|nr:ATP synthase F1 subunit delta [Candidatus Hennigella equi]